MTHWLSACNVLIVYLLGFGHWVRKIVSGTCVIDDFLQVGVLIWSHLSYTLFLTFRVICNQCLFRSLKKNCGYLVYNNFSVQSQLTITTWPKDKWIAEKKKRNPVPVCSSGLWAWGVFPLKWFYELLRCESCHLPFLFPIITFFLKKINK